MTLQPRIPLRAPAGIAAFTFTAAAVPLTALAHAFSSDRQSRAFSRITPVRES
jgi:hypothetical protein